LHAGDDEEDRDQEAVPDRVQFAVVALLRRPVVAVGDVEHDARNERAEQSVDAELVRHCGEDEQDREGTADAQLRGALVGNKKCLS